MVKYSEVVEWTWLDGSTEDVVMLVSDPDEDGHRKICEVYSIQYDVWKDAGDLGEYQGEILYDTFKEALKA